jgi:predicted SnoaL-like aldol condensation-catalyzing enzyme
LSFTILYTYDAAFVDSPTLAQTNQTQTNLTSSEQSQKEIRNENTVREFYKDVFDAKNASAAVNYIEENYIQHNPFVPTGRQAFIDFFTGFFNQNLDYSSEIQKIYTDGDYVLVHHLSRSNNTDSAIIDMYRLNNAGKIAEHWDVIQQIPPSSANNNTMFYLE